MKPALNSLQNTEYLGDGLYVGHDGYQIWLLAHNGISTQEAVALEPQTMDQLIAYNEKLKTMRTG